MLFSTCLCLKKNVLQRMYYSNNVSKRLTAFTTTKKTSRGYCTLLHTSTVTKTRSFHRLLKYPQKKYDNNYLYDQKYLSTKSIILSAYKKEHYSLDTDDSGLIEKLNYPSLDLQQLQQHEPYVISSTSSTTKKDTHIDPSYATIETAYNSKDIDPEFDTTALKKCLEKEQLGKALALMLNSKISSSLPTNTDSLDYPLKDRILFFDKLSKLPLTQLITLLQPWIDQQQQQQLASRSKKRLHSFLKTLGSTLPKDSILYLLHHFYKYNNIQLIMFQQYINHYYIRNKMGDQDQQLDNLLDYLKNNNNDNNNNLDPVLKIQLFNMTINGCIKTKKQDHITKVLNQMEKSGVALDEITFNILIRSQLDMNRPQAANALYEKMKNCSLTPTVSTFNTFIKYACKHQNWNDLSHWLDHMEQHDRQPNPITLRIMMDALTNNITEQQVIDDFKRVADHVSITNQDIEWTLNISITQLLRNKHVDTALDILQKLFEQRPKMEIHSYSLSAYSYNLLIHAYTLKGDLDAAENVLSIMKKKIYHHQEQIVNGKEMDLTIPSPDIVSYTTLIHGYIRSAPSHHINMERITALYNELIERGLEENRSLQSVILFGLIKSGFYDSKKSMKFFRLLVNDNDDDVFKIQHQDRLHKDHSKQPKDLNLSKVILYNMMMDGYFINQFNHNQARLSSNKTRSFNLNQKIDSHIPKKSIQLLKEAIEKDLPLDTSTLNIWVRGLSLFNHDINMAEYMVHWMTKKYQININERTVFYLVKAAIKQRRLDKARKWIHAYEKNGKTIQGNGLLKLKRMAMGE